MAGILSPLWRKPTSMPSCIQKERYFSFLKHHAMCYIICKLEREGTLNKKLCKCLKVISSFLMVVWIFCHNKLNMYRLDGQKWRFQSFNLDVWQVPLISGRFLLLLVYSLADYPKTLLAGSPQLYSGEPANLISYGVWNLQE